MHLDLKDGLEQYYFYLSVTLTTDYISEGFVTKSETMAFCWQVLGRHSLQLSLLAEGNCPAPPPEPQHCPVPAAHHHPGQWVTARGLILGTEYLGRGGQCPNNPQCPLLTAQGGCAAGQLHCSGGSCCLLLPRLLNPSPSLCACVCSHQETVKEQRWHWKNNGCVEIGLIPPSIHPAPSSLLQKREKRSQQLTTWVVFMSRSNLSISILQNILFGFLFTLRTQL